jgi:hypothetical protein
MLEIGLPRQSVAAARILGNSLSRAQYLSLGHSGFNTPDQIEQADKAQLNNLLGEALATATLQRLRDTREAD